MGEENTMASTFVYPTHQGLRGHAFITQISILYAPSPIRLHQADYPFWNKLPAEIVNASSVKSAGSAGRILAVPVSRSTHLTHLLPHPIPSAHVDPCKNSALITLPIYPHYPLVVYGGLYCSVDQQNYDLI